MKSSQLAKTYLTQELAFGVFEQCEQMVMGITSGVSVPLPLNKNDTDIVTDVVLQKTKECASFDLKTETTIKHRAAGLFKQWLIQKGRIK